MTTSFTDCCIRYGQEFVYTRFSEGNMMLGEIYMALAYGLIDPTCLPAMSIIHHDNKIWCTDTRRLTIAKELERRNRFDILQSMNVREVKRNTPQYRDFVNHRLPAMQRKGLDGLTVEVSDRRGPTCCFNSESRFRMDLEQHIMRDHLTNFNIELFQNLTSYYCHMCKTNTTITCTKSACRSYYQIIRRCGCKPKKPHQFAKPWSGLTFSDLCNELLQYNHSLKGKFLVQNSTHRINDRMITCHSMATQTESTNKVTTALQLVHSHQKPQFTVSPEYCTWFDDLQNRSDIDIVRKTLLKNVVDQELYWSPKSLVAAKHDANKIEVLADSLQDNKKINKRVRTHHRLPKSCCNIS